eukprot:TRINITY_DN735_c0_g1_i5.p1 TRINITY_DN735_c0_g1~~TRINITY_DN735_c0_g1_i5.p1  ORF type:complete len:355 (-),score=40.93 TRINITY_DN735_c0_g1_i5:395-1459(-)
MAQTIFFTGGNHADTRGKIDDTQTILKDYKTWRISRIEVLASNTYIGALHIHYKVLGLEDEISSGSHIGSAVLRESPYTWSELMLDDDEYLTEISGRSAHLIDAISLTTSKGQTLNVGGKGGTSFRWFAPQGYHFNLISFSTNGHVHNLEASPVEIPSMTSSLESVTKNRFPWKVEGEDYTNEMLNPYCYRFAKVGCGIKRSKEVGAGLKDETHFDDLFDYLEGSFFRPELYKFSILHDGKRVYGIEISYKTTRGETLYQGPKKGSAEPADNVIKTDTLELYGQDRIMVLSGEYDENGITYLDVVTHKGKRMQAGIAGVGKSFGNLVSLSSGRIVGFGGSYGEYLRTLYIYEML